MYGVVQKDTAAVLHMPSTVVKCCAMYETKSLLETLFDTTVPIVGIMLRS